MFAASARRDPNTVAKEKPRNVSDCPSHGWRNAVSRVENVVETHSKNRSEYSSREKKATSRVLELKNTWSGFGLSRRSTYTRYDGLRYHAANRLTGITLFDGVLFRSFV